MTSLQIAYFLKVSEYMSFSQAAQALYVSQPSVSRQIKLLERELGYTLFDRTRKNAISLTAAGVVFREAFQQADAQLQEARAAAQALSGSPELQLRVGIGEYWDMSEELIAVRAQLLHRYPRMRLSFGSYPFQQLRQKLRNGELDVILCTKTSLIDFDGLEVRPVADLECRVYVRRGLLRPAEEPLCAADFEGQRLLMLCEEESPMAMELALLQFQAQQVRVTPVWMPSRDAILQALLLGEGVAVFDQYVRFRSDPRLTSLRMEEFIPICIVWKQDAHDSLVHLFAEQMTEAISRTGGAPKPTPA